MIQVLEGCWAREGGNTNLKSGTTNWGRSSMDVDLQTLNQ